MAYTTALTRWIRSGLLVGLFASTAAGCARPRPESGRLPAWVLDAARREETARALHLNPRGGVRGRSDASDLVVAVLQEQGLHFGTDGSVAALWGYLRTAHAPVAAREARRGDVLFFQTHAQTNAEDGQRCSAPDHVAVVSDTDARGRIQFIEARDGRARRSYVDPARPQQRRDEDGRILNTFLRPKKITDPADTPTFAGEMLCAAIRPRAPVQSKVPPRTTLATVK